MSRGIEKKNAFQAMCLHVIVLVGIVLFVLVLPAAPALAQGKGQGKGGGGGGGGEPPAAADPAISFYASTSSQGGTLMVMNADGSNGSGLLPVEWLGSPSARMRAAWSPDLDGDPSNGYRGTIAFSQPCADGTCARAIWLADVRVVDGVTTALRVRQLTGVDSFYPEWSPDLDPSQPGYQGFLTFASQELGTRGIWGLAVEWDANAVDPSTIEAPVAELIVPAPDATAPMPHSWSPEGDRIAFAMRVDPLSNAADWLIFVIDDFMEPMDQRLIAQIPGIEFLSWSRTSSWIAVAYQDGVVQPILLMDVDQPESSLSISHAGTTPAWAPDDSAIIFSGRTGGGGWLRILKYDFATTQVSELAKPPGGVHYMAPHWRPY